jgi:DNA-binding transcriptional LysR family regulator
VLRLPLVRTRLQTGMTSAEVVAQLRTFDVDAGIIHPSAADGEDIITTPLPELACTVIASPGLFPAGSRSVTGEMLTAVPLCLLTPGMRARQILDSALYSRGIELRPSVEADSVEALVALVATGRWAALAPDTTALTSLLEATDSGSPIQMYTLDSPEVTMPLSFARLAADPAPAVARALEEVAAALR